MSPQHSDYFTASQSLDAPLRNQLKRVDHGKGSDCLFTMECNGKHFEVFLLSSASKGTVERHYLDCIDSESDAAALDLLFDEICDIIAVKCQPRFKRFAGRSTHNNFPRALSEFIEPPVVSLQMITVDREPHIILREDDAISYHNKAVCGIPKNCFSSTLPTYWLSEIQVLEVLKVDAVFKVQVGGATMCAKVAVQQSQRSPLRREIGILQRIRPNQEHPPVCNHIPSILGLIVLEDLVLGFLMDYVLTASPSNLAEYEMGSVSLVDRKRWYYQVKDTLEQLHDMSLSWGDVKAENILVDRHGNAWVTDFGGSYTSGWVEQNLAGSTQGDLQGLERLINFLQVHK